MVALSGSVEWATSSQSIATVRATAAPIRGSDSSVTNRRSERRRAGLVTVLTITTTANPHQQKSAGLGEEGCPTMSKKSQISWPVSQSTDASVHSAQRARASPLPARQARKAPPIALVAASDHERSHRTVEERPARAE